MGQDGQDLMSVHTEPSRAYRSSRRMPRMQTRRDVRSVTYVGIELPKALFGRNAFRDGAICHSVLWLCLSCSPPPGEGRAYNIGTGFEPSLLLAPPPKYLMFAPGRPEALGDLAHVQLSTGLEHMISGKSR